MRRRRRAESHLLSAALLVLLALVLLYGCRAFVPEPFVFNYPPDTFITGAPAETTGTRFARHLYWFGVDRDGTVMRYIYALTDSTVRDPSIPDVDEENQRFDPAHDVRTLRDEPGRKVGWTTLTDSVFVIEIDRGEVTSKDVTFHVVAIDDRGAIDPTPARLHFFSNSLGNPLLRFSLYTDEGPEGGPSQWKLRWVGGVEGPASGLSPEGSSQPFAGFGRPFRIAWEASSPNGPIVGYRYRASQDILQPWIPAEESGVPRWDPSLTSFDYANEVPPEEIEGCDLGTGRGCRPDILLWPSGDYRLWVQAIDVALVQSHASDGELDFGVNYPPESSLVRDATHPRWRLELPGGEIREAAFVEGDTVPVGAYTIFRTTGFDRLEPSASDSFCCDEKLDPASPEVGYQGLIQMIGDDGGRVRRFQSLYSFPSWSDTLGFLSGPFDYTFNGRTVDEHLRPDLEADRLRFTAGMPPRITEVRPGEQDVLVLRNPQVAQVEGPWPQNTYPYTTERDGLYWDGVQWLEDPPAPGAPPYDGYWFRIQPRFYGQADPRDPLGRVRAWAYSFWSEHDPNNAIPNGPRDSSDLYFFTDARVMDQWEFDSLEAFAIFVPDTFWQLPQLFSEGAPPSQFKQIGAYLRQQLGQMLLRVQARTTTSYDVYRLHLRVRRETGLDPQTIVLDRMGRRSEIAQIRFPMHLGLKDETGALGLLWPDW